MNLKRKHHYIPQFYLSSWANPKKQVYVLIENKIMPLKVNKILLETDFYQLPKFFSNEQIDFFWEYLCKHFLKFENYAIKSSIYLLEKLLDKKWNDLTSFIYTHSNHVQNISQELYKENQEIIKKLDVERFNLIEDYLSKYEEKWGIILKKIKNNELENLDYHDYEDLCSFCAFTLCRTQYMRNKQLTILKKILNDTNMHKFNDDELNDLLLILLIFIIPVQLSNIFLNKAIIFTVIHNNTNSNLITNDNPVKNIKFHENLTEFLIPISPKILLKAEIIDNKDMISYLNEYFENDINRMKEWEKANRDMDNISLNNFPKSTSKSIHNLLLFETTWDDISKINELNNYMNEQKNNYIIGKQREDLEPFIKQAL